MPNIFGFPFQKPACYVITYANLPISDAAANSLFISYKNKYGTNGSGFMAFVRKLSDYYCIKPVKINWIKNNTEDGMIANIQEVITKKITIELNSEEYTNMVNELITMTDGNPSSPMLDKLLECLKRFK